MTRHVDITLTWAEFFEGVLEGAKRHCRMLRNNIAHTNGKSSDRPEKEWDDHIEGTIAERAWAKYADLDWDAYCEESMARGLHDGGVDIGGVSVRHTWKLDGRLLVQKTDREDIQAVLVTGTGPHRRLAGWIWVEEAKRVGRWRTYEKWEKQHPNARRKRRPCFWIEPDQLRPMEEILDSLPGRW